MTNLEILSTLIHSNGEFDWKKKGASMYHYVYPTQVSDDLIKTFNDGLLETVWPKLEECHDRFKELLKKEKQAIKFISMPGWNETEKMIATRLLAETLKEKVFIQKWERYWLEIALKLKEYKPRVKKELITDMDVQRAKEYSLTKLYGKEMRHSYGRALGLCPFHEENTPSFTIYENENTYHCFGCGVHGDSINYLMETENVGFIEAVKRLC